MKDYKVKDIPVGSLFSLSRPESGQCPTYLRIEKTETLVNEWNKNLKAVLPTANSSEWIKPDDVLALNESGFLCKWDLDLNCYLHAKEPYDQRPKQYWDAFETRYPHVKQTPNVEENNHAVHLERKDIKSGLFFAFGPEIYLAVERNADTEFYFKKQVTLKNNKAGMGTDFSVALREANMFCLDKHAVMWTADKNAYVVLAKDILAQDMLALRAQLSSTYFETLKRYCISEGINPDVASRLPLYETHQVQVPRKDIKSGQFFKERNCVYLAIERNADTEFFFAKSNHVADTYICADHMLCISSDARMLTTNKDFLVTPAEDIPDLRDQLVSIYGDALKEYCAADNVNPIGRPLYKDQGTGRIPPSPCGSAFYSPIVVRTLPPKGAYTELSVKDEPTDKLPKDIVPRSAIRPGCLFRAYGFIQLAIDTKELPSYIIMNLSLKDHELTSISKDGVAYKLNKNTLCEIVEQFSDDTRPKTFSWRMSGDAYCKRFKLIPASEVAKSLEIVKAANQVVSVDGQFTGLENGDGLDATQRLYQDQRDYFKREERKAQAEEIARIQKQLSTFIPDGRLETDFKGEDKRHDELVFTKKNLLNSFHCAEYTSRSLAKLDKHGWGNVSRDEELDVREAVTELQAFIKKWYKKHKKVVGH